MDVTIKQLRFAPNIRKVALGETCQASDALPGKKEHFKYSQKERIKKVMGVG